MSLHSGRGGGSRYTVMRYDFGCTPGVHDLLRLSLTFGHKSINGCIPRCHQSSQRMFQDKNKVYLNGFQRSRVQVVIDKVRSILFVSLFRVHNYALTEMINAIVSWVLYFRVSKGAVRCRRTYSCMR